MSQYMRRCTMRTDGTLFSPELEAKIVSCVEEAVGNDIQEDTQNADLIGTQNSVPSRIWDLINRNLVRKINAQECKIAKAHTGPWQMLMAYDPNTFNIFTFMREKRFRDVQRYRRSRKRMHYLDALTKQFNPNLSANSEQLSLIPHVFSDEDRLAERVQSLLRDFDSDIEVVRNHVLVLFETIGDQLVHIRAVKVTPNLDIAQGCEWDWSKYISGATSAVVEKIDEKDAPENQPSRGLTFTGKALARKKNKLQHKNMDREKHMEG